ncbi:hypothetical protein Tco_0633066 [Tanacetum coccineum]
MSQNTARQREQRNNPDNNPGDVFTRLGEKRRSIRSRLGPEAAKQDRYVSKRRGYARVLIQSRVTRPSKRHQEVEEEWDTVDHGNRRPHSRTEERYYSEEDHSQGGH